MVPLEAEVLRAIRHLMTNLPQNLQGLWLRADQLHGCLQRGGFPSLPMSDVMCSLKNNHFDFACDRYGKKSTRHFLCGNDATNRYKCVKDQVDDEICIPEMTENFYVEERNFFLEEVNILQGKGYCRLSPAIEGTENCDTTTPKPPPLATTTEHEKENRMPAGLKIVDVDVDN
jgi:hypothetical protein